ncbi:MAG: LON peptidase substrate-binding domain-containing protein, partial [Pseudomonadota bacterium]
MSDDKKTEIGFDPAGGVFPVLPLRDIVVFPHMIVPLFVGREKSITSSSAVID